MNLIGKLLVHKIKEHKALYLIINDKIDKITCIDLHGCIYNTTVEYATQFYDIKDF